MTELSSLFYGLKRSALVFLTSLLLLSLQVVDDDSEVFGIKLATGMGGVFLWLLFFAALFFSISFFFTAFIDARRILPRQVRELQDTEDDLKAASQSLSVAAQRLPLSEVRPLSEETIHEAMKSERGAATLLETWKSRAGWAERGVELNDAIQDRIDRAISSAVSQAISMSPNGALLNNPEVLNGLNKSVLDTFRETVKSGFMIEIREEISKQANETRQYFTSLAENLGAVASNQIAAAETHAVRIAPVVQQIRDMAENLNASVIYVSTSRNALNFRFWAFDVGAVVILFLVSFLHFLGIWMPLCKSFLLELPRIPER